MDLQSEKVGKGAYREKNKVCTERLNQDALWVQRMAVILKKVASREKGRERWGGISKSRLNHQLEIKPQSDMSNSTQEKKKKSTLSFCRKWSH